MRVGLACQSYIHHFVAGAVKQRNDIAAILADSDTLSATTRIQQAVERLDIQQYYLDAVDQCARDTTGCLVTLDVQTTLQKRDRLLATLIQTYARHTTSLRSSEFSNVDLLPSVDSLLNSKEADLDVQRGLLKVYEQQMTKNIPSTQASGFGKKKKTKMVPRRLARRNNFPDPTSAGQHYSAGGRGRARGAGNPYVPRGHSGRGRGRGGAGAAAAVSSGTTPASK